MQVEFKVKHYLSSNPFVGGKHGQFKLDIVTKEILEIFSNQLRVSIERLNILRKYQSKKAKFLGTLAGAGQLFSISGSRHVSPSREPFRINSMNSQNANEQVMRPMTANYFEQSNVNLDVMF